MFSELDREFMQAALAEAGGGLYTTQPNPRVGCVIAKGNRVVGRGLHKIAGGPHAEIDALADAGLEARGATAYVTLEPCCHQGRTGPCTEALIAADVARVVYAHEDPNPEVAGKGARRLQEAGIAVAGGLLEDAARALNEGYLSRVERGRPFVRCKVGISLDGRTALADGHSQWITGKAARADVQHYRARSSAIVTGIGTVLADDPHLNARLALPGIEIHQPARVILDSRLRTPPDARLFAAGGPVHVFTAADSGSQLPRATVHAVPAGETGLDLAAVMAALAELEFNEVLVEAGAILTGSLLQAGLVDELLVYQAPVLLGKDARGLADFGPLRAMSERLEFELRESTVVGEDLRLALRPRVAG